MLPTDLEATFKAAADPQIWSQHPAHDRHRREVFEAYFGMLVHAGGSMVVIDDASGAVIGCTRYYPVPGHSEDVAIGFTFLARAYWGGGWNAEMKGLMLTYAFQHVARVWFHVAPGNRRSQIAVERLGATLVAVEEVDVGTGSALTHCYAMTRPLTMTTP